MVKASAVRVEDPRFESCLRQDFGGGGGGGGGGGQAIPVT